MRQRDFTGAGIVAAAHQPRVADGVMRRADTVEAMLAHVEAAMLLSSPVRPGQQVILIGGLPPSKLVPANFILLHTVGRS